RAAITPTFAVRQHRARHHVAAVGESLCPYAERHRNIAGTHSTSPAISSATPEAHDVDFRAAVMHINEEHCTAFFFGETGSEERPSSRGGLSTSPYSLWRWLHARVWLLRPKDRTGELRFSPQHQRLASHPP